MSVDRQSVGGRACGGPTTDTACLRLGSACGPLLNVATDDIKSQIDPADVFQRLVLKVDEVLRTVVEHRLAVSGASGANNVGAGLVPAAPPPTPTAPAAPCTRTLCPT